MPDRAEPPAEGATKPDPTAWPDLDTDSSANGAKESDKKAESKGPELSITYAWPGADEPATPTVQWPAEAAPDEPESDAGDAEEEEETRREIEPVAQADDEPDAEPEPDPVAEVDEPEPEVVVEATPEPVAEVEPGAEPEEDDTEEPATVEDEPGQATAVFPPAKPEPEPKAVEPQQDTAVFVSAEPEPKAVEPEQDTAAMPVEPESATAVFPPAKPAPEADTAAIGRPAEPERETAALPVEPAERPTDAFPVEREPEPTARMTPVADPASTQLLPRIEPAAPPKPPAKPPTTPPRAQPRIESTQVIPVIRDVPKPAETTRHIPVVPAETTQHIPLPPKAGPRPAETTQLIPTFDDYDESYDDTYETEPDRPEPQRPPKPRRRRRKRVLLVSAGVVVVVVAVAAAVVLTSPTLATKLGLRSVAGPVTQAPPSPVVFSAQLKPPNDSAPMPSDAGVGRTLAPDAGNPVVGSLAGIVLDAASGQVLWDHGSTTQVAPASTNKILTSAAALLSLGPQTTLDTTVVAGAQPGTIVLVGGGDPTLSSLPAPQQSVYTGAARIDDLAAQVKAHNPGQITKIVVDVSRFGGPTSAPGWDPPGPSQHNWAPIQSVMLDGGRLNPTQTDTARTYSPALVAGQALAGQLGVPTTAVTTTNTPTPSGAQVLGEVHSQTVPDLVTNLLQISDNVLAEVMGRTVALADNQPPTFTGATTAVLDVLRRNGFDTTGASLSDSSGLSPNDRLPPRLLAQVLRVAASSDTSDPRVAKLRPLLLGLPIAGSPVGDGTLSGRYQTSPSSAGKGWVRAKTGTLTDQGVFALAGVVLDSDGRVLVFALVSNQAPSALAPGVLDTMAAALRGCGCRS